jgi:hypothetical protein
MLENMRVPASPRSSRHSASMSSMTRVAASASLSLSWPKKQRIAPSSLGAEGKTRPSMPRHHAASMMRAENPWNICMRCLCSICASSSESFAS